MNTAVKFNTDLKVKGKYNIVRGDLKIKLLSKVPKGMYYSFLNDIGLFVEQHLEKRISFPRNHNTQPQPGQIVYGYDEWGKEWSLVQYRTDSNRFFTYPYNGEVWPSNRMNKWIPSNICNE